MEKLYTQKEVIALLVKERERGIRIVDVFYTRYKNEAKSYSDDEADKDLKYMAKCEAEVCRKISNTIDGRLLASIYEPIEEEIKSEYFPNNVAP